MLEKDLTAFVGASIRSIWALEVLLLLRARDAPLAVEELVRALRGSRSLVEGCLTQLQAAGVTAREDDGRWRYRAASPELDQTVARLAAVYAERPFAVIDAIVSTPNQRLKSFADAFRFPKKED